VDAAARFSAGEKAQLCNTATIIKQDGCREKEKPGYTRSLDPGGKGAEEGKTGLITKK